MNGDRRRFSLHEATQERNATLLLFYPFDFSPVCTTELCAIRDAEWFEFTENLDVWAISGDSVHAHEAFADEYDLHFPLLSDSDAAVAEAYDVRYDEWDGHAAIPKRAVFLIDSDRTVQYAWSTDDALEKPDFVPVKSAVDALADLPDSDVDGAEISLDVDYEAES